MLFLSYFSLKVAASKRPLVPSKEFYSANCPELPVAHGHISSQVISEHPAEYLGRGGSNRVYRKKTYTRPTDVDGNVRPSAQKDLFGFLPQAELPVLFRS